MQAQYINFLCSQEDKNMNRILFSLLNILFWFSPLVAQAYYTYDPRVNSPRYPQCMAEYNKCDEPCLTQMGGNASYACHNVCAANFDKCVAGDSQRENVEDVNSKYRLKQKCDSLRSSCELYTCDKFHGMGESRACFESCKAQAEQCMAASGLAPQPTQKTVMISPLRLTPQEMEWFVKLPTKDARRFIISKLTPEERELWNKLTETDRVRFLMCKITGTEC